MVLFVPEMVRLARGESCTCPSEGMVGDWRLSELQQGCLCIQANHKTSVDLAECSKLCVPPSMYQLL